MSTEDEALDAILSKLREELREELSLKDKNIVVTGKLYNFTRDEVIHEIISKGGSSPGTVSDKTVALVVGERPGSIKVSAAIRKGIPILTEDQLMNMLRA